MKTHLLAVTVGLGFIAFAATSSQAADTTLESMPPKLETQFALSALPPALRDKATIYLLDPKQGYSIARQGTSGIACVVERTVWEMADFRNDIYIPLCYDAAGIHGHFQAIIDSAALRAQGMSPAALKAEIEKRYRNQIYKTPERAGLSYMIAPLMRTIGPPDMKVHTMSMPHLMFYAPGVTNADIGALPDLAVPATLQYPFIDKQGNAEQSYMIQMVGASEKAKILADEKQLLDALCAHRDLLCLGDEQHH
jgi:hypothetical protein